MCQNEKNRTTITLIICITLLCLFYLHMHSITGNRLFNHSGFDSYTLQAMQWRKGDIKLDHDYPHLELAIYKGDYYVSFPPVPAIPMFLLSFICGENTPSHLVVTIYNIITFAFAFLCCRRLGSNIVLSITGASFVCLASSALFLSMTGGVWFLAQTLAICLTMAAFYYILGNNKKGWHAGMLLLALSVGCRPFQVLYFIFFIYLLLVKNSFKIKRIWSYFITPGIIAISYMTYNYVRFKDIFEFGHNYLPEFTRDEPGNYGQFSIKYVLERFHEFFTRIPKLTEEGLDYNQFAFAFFIACVLFIVMYASVFIYLNKASLREADSNNLIPIILLLILSSVHIFLILMHRTSGGWQFGARYMADILPAALVCTLLCKNLLYKKIHSSVIMLCAFGIALNILGASTMYLN